MRLERIIRTHKPKVVCFIGKVAYEKYIETKKFTFGRQNDINGSKAYVMHFPLRGKADVRIEELKIVTGLRDADERFLAALDHLD